jgi:hypothetical protein
MLVSYPRTISSSWNITDPRTWPNGQVTRTWLAELFRCHSQGSWASWNGWTIFFSFRWGPVCLQDSVSQFPLGISDSCLGLDWQVKEKALQMFRGLGKNQRSHICRCLWLYPWCHLPFNPWDWAACLPHPWGGQGGWVSGSCWGCCLERRNIDCLSVCDLGKIA